jgi:hypothetical protein
MINRSTLFGFIAIFLWSSKVALSHSISEQVRPWMLGFTVFTAARVMLAVGAAVKKRKFNIAESQVLTTALRGLMFLVYTFSLFLRWILPLGSYF